MAIEQGGTTKHISLSSITKITFVTPNSFICGTSTVDDADGNTYNTVVIGCQCWMKENLRVGTKIAGTSDQTNNSTIEKYCYDDSDANCDTYGGLYQWNEAMQYVPNEGAQGICPPGWHIPTYYELIALVVAAGTSGNALQAVGQGAGTNTSGFSALFAGRRTIYLFDLFSNLDFLTYFWSSTYGGAGVFGEYYLGLPGSGGDTVDFDTEDPDYGFSIRCLKDN